MTNIERRDEFDSLPFWGELSAEEKRTVIHATDGLREASVGVANLRIKMGEHLAKVEKVLKDIRRWDIYLQTFSSFSSKTARRYIVLYETVSKKLSPANLAALSERGIEVGSSSNPERPLGPIQDLLAENPPPKSDDPDKNRLWSAQIEEKKRLLRQKRDITPRECEKKAFQWVRRYYRRAGLTGRAHDKWARGLLGKLLLEFGYTSKQTIEPEAAPEDFTKPVGWQKGRKRAHGYQ